MVKNFIERHPEDVAIDRGHAFGSPVFGMFGNGAVESCNFDDGAFKQAARELVNIQREIAPLQEGLQDVGRGVLADLPLKKHLEG